MLLLLLAVGCQQDLVRVMGTVTGVKVVPRAPSVAAEAPPHETLSLPATVSTPTAPAQVEVAAPAQPVASAKPPKPSSSSFNPISMPEGPRDSPGVRWQGVRGTKTQESLATDRNLRKRDPP
jgi:hypothetical protein